MVALVVITIIWFLSLAVVPMAFSQSAGSSIKIDASDTTSAASAASIQSAHCMKGFSAQTGDGGGALSVGDPMCQHLEMSERYLLAWERMRGWCDKDGNPACDYELEERFYFLHLDHLEQANRIMQQTSVTGQIGKTALQLLPTLAMIVAIIFI
jgi:hypothetical protein